jgi:uncharacterized surface protein with fasciclin (FAS1) repeats
MALARKPISRPTGSAAMTLAAGALAMTVAACGSSASSTSATSHRSASPAPHMSEHMTEHAMTIGTDCGMIPSAGMGSLRGMASDPVVTGASHDPLITTFAAEVQKAGLTSTLNSAHAITVFAPDNQAFSKLSAHDMSMMSGQAELAKILDYHVVQGQITPADFVRGMTLTTLEGGQLKISKMGNEYEVNNAAITCGNVQTANATVYIIDTVLIPTP